MKKITTLIFVLISCSLWGQNDTILGISPYGADPENTGGIFAIHSNYDSVKYLQKFGYGNRVSSIQYLYPSKDGFVGFGGLKNYSKGDYGFFSYNLSTHKCSALLQLNQDSFKVSRDLAVAKNGMIYGIASVRQDSATWVERVFSFNANNSEISILLTKDLGVPFKISSSDSLLFINYSSQSGRKLLGYDYIKDSIWELKVNAPDDFHFIDYDSMGNIIYLTSSDRKIYINEKELVNRELFHFPKAPWRLGNDEPFTMIAAGIACFHFTDDKSNMLGIMSYGYKTNISDTIHVSPEGDSRLINIIDDSNIYYVFKDTIRRYNVHTKSTYKLNELEFDPNYKFKHIFLKKGGAIYFKSFVEDSKIVYRYSESNGSLDTVFRLYNHKLGQNPILGLTRGQNCNFYGIAQAGGVKNSGSLYEFDLANNHIKKLVSFDYLNRSVGAYPSSIFAASNGNIYGVSRHGIQSNGCFWVYDRTKKSLSCEFALTDPVLHGETLSDPIIELPGEKFVLITAYGGTNGNGTILQYDLQTKTLTKLADNPISNSRKFRNTLAWDGKDILYGLIGMESNDDVQMFTFNLVTNNINIDSQNKLFADITLAPTIVIDGNNLFLNQTGTDAIISYDIANKNKTSLLSLKRLNGQRVGTMLKVKNKLIGTTYDPNFKEYGSFFEIDLSSNQLNIKYNYSDTLSPLSHPLIALENCVSSSIGEFKLQNFAGIYPNPAINQITVELKETPIGQTTISILTIHGQLVETHQITNQQEIINVGHLESGVYLLRITDAERMKVVRLVKE